MNYDRVIIELIDRVSKLEEEVAELKNKTAAGNDARHTPNEGIFAAYSSSNHGRDKTKYIVDGVRYGKNRMVLAVVRKYVSENPGITASQLMLTFDRSLQGSLGVIRTLEDVKGSYADYRRRFFCNRDEIIHTSTDDCVVCTQWGSFNVGNVLARAKELGIQITEI